MARPRTIDLAAAAVLCDTTPGWHVLGIVHKATGRRYQQRFTAAGYDATHELRCRLTRRVDVEVSMRRLEAE